MKRMMGLVCTNYSEENLGMLTEERPVASIPFGGRYRMIDFPLSNMVNSGMNTVGLITPYMYRSLMDHVGNGKAWSLSRKVGGMFILAGTISGLKNSQGKFLLRDIIQNRAYLERSRRDLVIVTGCSKIYNIDFREVAEQHERTGAMVTLIFKHVSNGADFRDLNLVCDARGKVNAFRKAGEGDANQFIDAFIINRELLLKITDWYSAMDYMDLMEIIGENLDRIAVYGYEFSGYVGSVDSAAGYMNVSMDLLNPQVMAELFMGQRQISTKVQDNPPAKYFNHADVHNSMIATGCIIKGTVENSIIFRGCTIEEGTVVRNSVVMANCRIDERAVLDRVICDKYVQISKDVCLSGNANNPLVVTRKNYS